MKQSFTVSLAACASLIACASIESQDVPQTAPQAASVEGLSYYMPNKDFVVTLSIKGQKPEKAGIGTTPAYPDLSRQYVLRYGRNWLGKNTLDVAVTPAGLLSTATSSTQSGVAEALRGLASSVGSSQALGASAVPTGTVCSADGDYTFVFQKPGVYRPCGEAVTISIGAASAPVSAPVSAPPTGPAPEPEPQALSGPAQAGIFYRQERPYLVTVTGGAVNAAALVYSPSEARTHFLPIARTFFSGNSAEFELVDGMPKRYKQASDGEGLALFKLPADVLAAYFSALGSLFDSFKSNDGKQAQALGESLKLEFAKKKFDACMEALRAGDEDRIKALACN